LYNWIKPENTSDKIIDFLKKETPEIICLQEFYTKYKGKISEQSINRRLGDSIYLHISYTVRKPKVSNFGIATFTKYPIVHKGEIVFKNSFNQCIFTDIRIFDDTVRIYNVHLQSYRFLKQDYKTIDSLRFRYSDRQMKGLKGIYSRVKTTFQKRAIQADTIALHIKNSPHPVIVCGDFNDSPISYAYQKMSQGLKDAFIESGSGIGNTYFWKFPFYRIDYVLYDKNFKAFHYISPKTNFSDHYPVICNLVRTPEK
jgi:endonuclease/exonuclease/phosphatase family metal-dependent hydrolase